MSTIEIRPIESSKENARYIQRLAFMHFASGRFDRPERYANPENSVHIHRQRTHLKKNPTEYTGAYVNQKLAGYIQTSDWTDENYYAYAPPAEREHLDALREAGLDAALPLHLGISGFALDRNLSDELFDEGAERLLDVATDRAMYLGKTALNVAFHEYDLLQPTALDHGFQFTGRVSVAATSSDVLQRLYTKPLDL